MFSLSQLLTTISIGESNLINREDSKISATSCLAFQCLQLNSGAAAAGFFLLYIPELQHSAMKYRSSLQPAILSKV